MKKWYTMIFLIFLFVVGCSNETKQVATDSAIQERENEESTSETESVVQEVEDRYFISLEEFNQLFEQDSKEEQFIDGKFQMADGTIVYADYFRYGKSDLFDYATAIFYGGKLAHIELETTTTPEEFLSSLRITQDQNAAIDPSPNGFKINFDDKFHEKNVSVYPTEWE
ncbi:hypothetical protein [Pseudoneobacillus sp. C159]